MVTPLESGPGGRSGAFLVPPPGGGQRERPPKRPGGTPRNRTVTGGNDREREPGTSIPNTPGNDPRERPLRGGIDLPSRTVLHRARTLLGAHPEAPMISADEIGRLDRAHLRRLWSGRELQLPDQESEPAPTASCHDCGRPLPPAPHFRILRCPPCGVRAGRESLFPPGGARRGARGGANSTQIEDRT